MQKNVQIQNTQRGVAVGFQGDVSFSKVESLVQECQNGECDCSTQIMEKIDTMSLSGKDGDVSISLEGSNLNAKDVQSCMNSCECEF